jgi:hypothetical protein
MNAALDLERLAKLLGMLGSTFDGEVVTAARQAEALRRKFGLTWGEILAPNIPVIAPVARRRPIRRPASIEDRIEICIENIDLLTPWEKGFLRSIAKKPATAFPKNNSACWPG